MGTLDKKNPYLTIVSLLLYVHSFLKIPQIQILIALIA